MKSQAFSDVLNAAKKQIFPADRFFSRGNDKSAF